MLCPGCGQFVRCHACCRNGVDTGASDRHIARCTTEDAELLEVDNNAESDDELSG